MSSIFDSQADMEGNSFSNPMNPANQNSGWKLDPSLLSPAYAAPYRPAYSGSQPYQFRQPTFGQALGQLNPFGSEHMWGNDMDHSQHLGEGLIGRPADMTMSFAQNWALPGAAWAASTAFANRAASPYSYFYASELAKGTSAAQASAKAMAYQKIGKPLPAARWWDSLVDTRGVTAAGAWGRSHGANFAQGMASGLGVGENTAWAMARAGGAIGSVTASFVLPQAALYAVDKVAQKGIFEPYANTRTTQRDLRRNFAGVTFGEGVGDISGAGFSHSSATQIAQDITSHGMRDMAFDGTQYAQIADFSARTGLLDSTKAKQIASRVKEIADQVKMVLTISKDPSIQNAVEELAKLQLAGASTKGGVNSAAMTSYQNIARQASAAGISVQRMMSEMGMQGQYLFQANGMTPYIGQLAASSSYAAFKTAHRSGLISDAQMARMGGAEGASQSALTGGINAGQTLYNKMALFNSYSGRPGGAGGNQNMTDVLSNFGGAMAGDPLGTYGAIMAHSRAAAGAQIKQRGGLATQDQIMSMAKAMGALNPDGTLNAHRAMPLLAQIGYSEEGAIAYIEQQRALADPDTRRRMIEGYGKVTQENERSYIEQNLMYGGYLGRSYSGVAHGFMSMARGIKSVTADPVTNIVAKLSDAVRETRDDWKYGSSISKPLGSLSFDGGEVYGIKNLSAKQWNEVISYKDDLREMTKLGGIRVALEEAAEKGDPLAIAYLRNKTPSNLNKFLLAHRGKLDEGMVDELTKTSEGFAKLEKVNTAFINAGKGDSITEKAKASMGKVSDSIQSLTGATNAADSLALIGQTYSVLGAADDAGGRADAIAEAISKDPDGLLAKYLGNRKGSDAVSTLENLLKRSGDSGFLVAGAIAGSRQLSLDAVKKNSSLITDEKMRARFQQAGSDKEKSDVLLQYVQSLDPNSFGKEMPGFSDGQNVTSVQIGRIKSVMDDASISAREQANGNKLNFDGWTKFNDSVQKFEDAVKLFVGNVGPGGKSSSSDKGWWPLEKIEEWRLNRQKANNTPQPNTK